MLKYDIRTGVQKIKTKTATSLSIGILGIAGLGSSLAFIPALTHAANGNTTNWHVGYYNPGGRALSMGQAMNGPGLASFNFTNQSNTALLITSQGSQKGSLIGNDLNKTVTANFSISGATSSFTYYGEGTPDNPCGTPANTRLYFETSNAGGFDYTHYWWSNPASQILVNGSTLSVTATVEPAEWSDWNGQSGATELAGFNAAASNVTGIGLSFGGGCFFENGVGTTNGSGTFTLNSFTATPPPIL